MKPYDQQYLIYGNFVNFMTNNIFYEYEIMIEGGWTGFCTIYCPPKSEKYENFICPLFACE